MSRVNLVIVNNTGTTVKCTDIRCKKFSDLEENFTIPNNEKRTYTSDTNDRIFCEFQQIAPGDGKWRLAMTCPKSSHNSACGTYCAGLQSYEETGSPCTFTFKLGEKNEADWSHPAIDTGDMIKYGDC